jgi:hypothetical protein
VTLRQQRHHDVLEHVVAHLHGAVDVVLDASREEDGGFDLFLRD